MFHPVWGADQLDYMDGDEDDVDAFDGINNNAAPDINHDDYDMLTQVTDTSSAQVRNGMDIQGIPWDRLTITRKDYRLTRISQYQNYQNIPSSGTTSDKAFKPAAKDGNYYDFFFNTRLVKPTILHFQLRNLVWATSKHDVYLISNYSVLHWSSLLLRETEVLNFSGHIVPTEKYAGSLLEGFTHTQISTMAVRDRFMVAGGFQGELICKCLDMPGVNFCTRTTLDDNAIINSIEIYESTSGGLNFMASSNDGGVRTYEMERFQLINHFRFPWPVNHTSLSPDRSLLAVVGDDLHGLVVDAKNGKAVASIVGHLDYSFASAWHPEGHIFATGSQDKTCRVWDVRKLTSPVAVLKGHMGAIRSIRFSSDGKFLVFAEPADFVHIYNNTKGDYKNRQEIDFFGEISGISLSPDDEALYIGLWDRTYASLLHYKKKHEYGYLDSVM